MTATVLPFPSVYRNEYEVQVLRIRTAPRYYVQTERMTAPDGSEDPTVLEVAYNRHGHYIGTEEHAHNVCDVLDIEPEPIERPPGPDDQCMIGFCQADQRWYALRGRGGIVGFGIGSECKKGFSHYHAANKLDFERQCVDFWYDEDTYANTMAMGDQEWNGEPGVSISWQYRLDKQLPNLGIKPGSWGGTFMPYPKQWGRGEWTAQTLEDARQMAIDWVEGSS